MKPSSAKPDAEATLAQMDWVQGLARSLVSDASLADDVSQETWLAALRHPPSPERPVRSWLRRVVRNAVLQVQRREALRRGHEAHTSKADSLPSAGELVEKAAVQRTVVDAVLALDEPYRRTILLRYFQGLTPEAIARSTGTPVATVKTRLRRGLANLRERLDCEYRDRSTWLLAMAPLVQEAGALGAASTGALIVSTKTVVGAVAAVGAVVVGGVWWTSRGVEPKGEADVVAGTGAAELAATDPAEAGPLEAMSAPGERVEVEPRAASAPEVGDVVLSVVEHGKQSEPKADPSAIERALEVAVASFLTDAPRVEELRGALAELARAAEVEPGSFGVGEDGVLRGSLRLSTAAVRGEFHRAKDRWVVDLSLDMPPDDPEGTFMSRTVSLSIPDDLGVCKTTVQHHPDTRRDPGELLGRGDVRTVGWTVTTRAEGGTKLDSILMTLSEDGEGLAVGRLPNRPIQERPWDLDRSSYRPWADLLHPYAR